MRRGSCSAQPSRSENSGRPVSRSGFSGRNEVPILRRSPHRLALRERFMIGALARSRGWCDALPLGERLNA